jgi:alkaline phosphatase D
MAVHLRPRAHAPPLPATAGVVGGDLPRGIAKPALSRAADRPLITHGIQSGDVSIDSAVVWARADRPSRMLVEVATTDSFKNVRSAVFVDALPETDFTAKALIEGLPAGQDMFYRIRFQDHSFPTLLSAPQFGRFRTARANGATSRSYGRATPPAAAGASTRRAAACALMHHVEVPPDFFIHCGDHIYADCPIPSERKLPTAGCGRTS